jgi:hypothetical protein
MNTHIAEMACDLRPYGECKESKGSKTCGRMTVQYGDDCMRQFMNGQESLWQSVRMLLMMGGLRL